MNRALVFTVIGLAGVIFLGIFLWVGDDTSGVTYRLEELKRGDIKKSVSASGELNAVVTVEVGSEISGQVSRIHVDFNSKVKAGQVIARIDPESFIARVKQAEAELAVAKALVVTRRAGITQAIANIGNANSVLASVDADVSRLAVTSKNLKQDFDRKKILQKKGVVAVSTLDKARAAWQVSAAQLAGAKSQLAAQRSIIEARKAQLEIARAEVLHASAQVEQKAAALNIAQVNFKNTFIRSPVDGVVIDRNVDIGQTVAASLQAPILFTIAQDLRKMQVETNIDEADIGQIQPGQLATFNVDAFLGREFKGTIRQIRKKPQTVQNVVTYTVVIAAENSDLKLLPGMTANVQVHISNRENVLKLPNRSLRFQPPGLAEKPVASSRTGRRGGPPNMAARRVQAQARMKQLVKVVGLSDDQKEQVKEFGRGLRQRIRSLAQAGRGPGFREAIQKLRQENSTRITTILNPEQKLKYKQLLASRRMNPARPGRVWVLENGNPKAVNVMIGVGDGSATELMRGEVKEGQKVIIGMRRLQ